MSQKSILVAILILVHTVCFFNPSYILASPKSISQEGAVTLFGSDDIGVPFPSYITAISPVVKDKIKVINDLKFYGISSLGLKEIKQDVELLVNTARNIQGQKVEMKDINKNTIFVHSLVNDALQNRMSTLSNQNLSHLLLIANYLDIKPLMDSYSFFIAQRLHVPVKINLRSSKCLSIIRQQLKNNGLEIELDDLVLRIRKYLYLKRLHITEKDIADYIGLKGRPPIYVGFNGLPVELDLSQEHITGLNGMHRIGDPEKVTMLYLNQNHILGSDIDPDFPSNPFKTFTHLQFLYLQLNQLGELPDRFLKGAEHLKKLHLSNNQLSSLSENIFAELKSLEEICLNYNQLTKLPWDIFKDLHQVNFIDLSDNQLTYLPVRIFESFYHLQRVFLFNNHFTQTPAEFIRTHPTVEKVKCYF